MPIYYDTTRDARDRLAERTALNVHTIALNVHTIAVNINTIALYTHNDTPQGLHGDALKQPPDPLLIPS
eukprot:2653676-Pyramimonas_sp.AAC.1